MTAVGGAQQSRAGRWSWTWLEIGVGTSRFALPVDRVQEVARGALEAVPDAPAAARGVLEVHGRRVPVADAGALLELSAAPAGEGRVLVVDCRGRWLGLRVDAVVGLREIAPGAVRPLPLEVLSARSRALAGVTWAGDAWLILLDVDALLRQSEALARGEP